jgi:hypothetical protein
MRWPAAMVIPVFVITSFCARRAVFTCKTFEETEVCPAPGEENRDASACSEGAPATAMMLLAGWSESEREGESPAADSIGIGFPYPSRIYSSLQWN